MNQKIHQQQQLQLHNNRKPLDIRDLLRCVLKNDEEINSYDNSILNKEIRNSLFSVFHQILMNPPIHLPSHVSHSSITMQRGGAESINDNCSHGFLYFFDKNTKDHYLNDGIKWIKSKVNVRMILFDDEKNVYKLKTHKRDLGSHVLRRQTFSGVDDNGVFWKKFEYKLIKKEYYYKVGDASEKSEKLTVIDWPLLVHYLSRPTEVNELGTDNTSFDSDSSYVPSTPSASDSNLLISNEGYLKKELTINGNANANANANTNTNPKKRDSSGFNIPSLSTTSIFNKLFKKSKATNETSTPSTPTSSVSYNQIYTDSPMMTPSSSSPESLLSTPAPSSLLFPYQVATTTTTHPTTSTTTTSNSASSNLLIEDNYLIDFSDQNWNNNNLFLNQSPNSTMNNIFLPNQSNPSLTSSSSNLLNLSLNLPNNDHLISNSTNSNANNTPSTTSTTTTTTSTTQTSTTNNTNFQLQDANNLNTDNLSGLSECSIQSYTPDTSPSLEQSKIMVIVNGFACFEKKSKLSPLYYSFWAVFDEGLELLALPVAQNVLEFISPIWGDSGISHFSIACKQNGSRAIIQQTPPVPFCFTPSDHRGKLKIQFDRCKIYPPIQIIPKFKHTVKHLDLSHNALVNIDFLSGFYRLETLLLNHNMINENTIFPQLSELKNLDLSSNKIVFPTVGVFTEGYKLFWYRLFQSTPSLQELDLTDNEEYPSAPHHHYNYRIYIISRFPQLIRLDQKMVTLEERKHAQSVEFSYPDIV